MLSLLVPLVLTLAADPGASSAAGELLLADGDTAAAAGLFETTWNTTRDPVALVRAGQARARSGHHAHAVAYMTQALALDLSPALADAARSVLASSRRHTTHLTVELDLDHPGDTANLAAARIDAATPALYFALTATEGTQVVPLTLDPGRWRLELRQHNNRVVHILDVGPEPLTVQLHPRPSALPIDRHPRIFRLAGTITGGAIALTGLGLSLASESASRKMGDRIVVWDESSGDSIVRAAGQRFPGAGLLGAGLGVVAGSVTVSLPRLHQRRIAWAIEVGIGGSLIAAAAITGVGAMAMNAKLRQAPGFHDLVIPIDQYTAGSALLGLGLGLAASATVGLIMDAIAARQIPRLRAGVSPTGLTLSGTF